MNRASTLKHLIFVFALLPLFALAQETQPTTEATPEPVPVLTGIEIQSLERDISFDAMMQNLNLEEGDYRFEYKSTGTSLGFKIKKGDKKIGKWMPTNEAANPEGQVVAYRLGRYLRMSEIVIPSAYYTVRGRALSEFSRMVHGRVERYQIRRQNQIKILNELSRNSSSMFGAISAPADNYEVPSLVVWQSNTINRAHPIASFIRADGQMPGSREISLNGRRNKQGVTPRNSELNLAREFSKIMVLDILTGQWDRWSGGNVEEIFEGNRSHFISRDNGGSSMVGRGHLDKYFGIVTRFDREQIRMVRKLADDLRRDSAEVQKVLQMRNSTKSLSLRVDALLQHVERYVRGHGESRAYFPD